jgi:hypothetical protein
MKSYTDLEQSKALAKILPIDSADMEYMFLKKDNSMVSEVPFVKDGYEEPDCPYNMVHCWSLTALLNILPHCIDDTYDLVLGKLSDNKGWYVMYDDIDHFVFLYIAKSNLIDACVEMIVKLKEEDLL